MKYIIYDNENEIASFIDEKDAEHFLEWKREQMLQEMNSDILDQIAREHNLDRKYPGKFPMSIAEPYYKDAREKIKKSIILKKIDE